MADIKLFSLSNKVVSEIPSTSVTLERELQTVIEQNMFEFFGVNFLRSEYLITNGRIDSLGLDENYCPVIFEYKRSTNENVINQGLFYLDWLLDHKADFKLLVMDNPLLKDSADKVDWSMPQLICIANDFTKFDEHAINQMQRNIKLIRYKKFGKELILFENLNAPKVKPIIETSNIISSDKSSTQKTFLHQFESAPKDMQNIFISIKDYILSLGDDITEYQLKFYTAFKKIKNIACVEIYQKKIQMHLILNPETVDLKPEFIINVAGKGHWGTGDVRIVIKNMEEFEKIKYLIDRAYNEG